MNFSNYIVRTADVVKTGWLSMRPFTCYFANYELPLFIENHCKQGFEALGRCVLSLRSGEYIAKDNYSITETDYIYLTVGNFSKGDLDLTECTFLENDVGIKYEAIKAIDGDLIITRSGTVGKVSIFRTPQRYKEKFFIPSHHLAVIKTSMPEDHLFLKYFLNYSFCRDFFEAFSTGKVQKEITNWSIKRIPIPLSLDKTLLTEKFRAIDSCIKEQQKNNISLQDSIDEVLSDFGIKSKSLANYRTKTILPFFTDIAKNKALRIGAEYNDFWLTHDGHLFEGTDENIEIVPLKRIIKLATKNVLKKGMIDKSRILIDFEQINALYGTIQTDNVVTEIGSDKIEFRNCDLVTNKLDPYSGYTFINDPELNMIGTTELWPLNVVDKEKTDMQYIRYLLLSTEYLEKSKLLMSGKRHPRIHHLDFLNIKVPLPNPEIQQHIVNEIKLREAKSENARNEIKRLRESIDTLILKELEKNKS